MIFHLSVDSEYVSLGKTCATGAFALCKLKFGRADALQIACLTRAHAVSSASQMKKHIKKESPWLNYEPRAFCLVYLSDKSGLDHLSVF
jgi:hypothetical protein